MPGTANNDNLTGTSDNDFLDGLAGNDKLYGLSGDDQLRGGAGGDKLYGSFGVDTALYDTSNAAVHVSIHPNASVAWGGDATGDELHGIENLVGSRLDDELRGSLDQNRLEGRDGSDRIEAYGGNDEVLGGRGNDFLVGGAGGDYLNGGGDYDIASYYNSTAGVLVDFQNGQTSGGDAEGDELVAIEKVEGSNHSDSLLGNAAANVFAGLGGDDHLYGRGGFDQLNGGSGEDWIEGDWGSDILTGGGHADTFAFVTVQDSALGNTDQIVDFHHAEGDRIDLSNIDAKAHKSGEQAFKFIDNALFSGEGQIRVDHNNGTTIVYANISGQGGAEMTIQLNGDIDLSAADFLL